jgi:hypothetical protein
LAFTALLYNAKGYFAILFFLSFPIEIPNRMTLQIYIRICLLVPLPYSLMVMVA